jgi:hypothetical protein
MTVTTVPETTPKPESLWTPTIRRMATWTAVGVAVAAAGVLAVQVFASDSDYRPPAFTAERGSITAIDHLAEQGTAVTDVSGLAELGSITAIDHLAEEGTAVTDASGFVAERGSITALDHLAEQSALAGDVSQLVAERGSITAIDHLAEQND